MMICVLTNLDVGDEKTIGVLNWRHRKNLSRLDRWRTIKSPLPGVNPPNRADYSATASNSSITWTWRPAWSSTTVEMW